VKWPDLVHNDPISWLLEPKNPPVRYWTLRDLLDRPADDAEVCTAQAAVATYPPVAALLAAQKRDGYWIQRDYYLPKHNGTFWVLSVLADMGMTAEHGQIRRACEFMFTFQHESGAFGRRRRVPGQGIVWDGQEAPCSQARITRFLIQFGYQDDPRTRSAVDWLLCTPRDHGMWHCRAAGRGGNKRGCLRATIDVLRVAALDAEAAAHPAIFRGAAMVCNLLMEPGMSKYHVGIPWTTLEYPYVDYSLISTLDALARLGYTLENPKVSAALDNLLGRQGANGTWPLDYSPTRPPFEAGQPGEPNKWVTLDALRVVKLLYDQD
jgi:hypothetical protein